MGQLDKDKLEAVFLDLKKIVGVVAFRKGSVLKTQWVKTYSKRNQVLSSGKLIHKPQCHTDKQSLERKILKMFIKKHILLI